MGRFRKSVVGVLIMGLLGFEMGVAGELPLSEIDARFTPQETPVCMEYDVGYRLWNIEMSRVGKVVATTTIGKWHHRITGESIPALFLDMRIDSPDIGKTGRRNRVSIHDRIVAVLTIPDMQALLFAKHTDEYLRPMIRASESLGVSVYDTQAGRLEFEHRNLKTGVASTNLVNPEALLELSRKIRPIMEFLVQQYNAPTRDADTSDTGRIVANLDGKVAALRILTYRERSPSCLMRQRLDSMCVRSVAEHGSFAKPRDFFAWTMTFEKLALALHDDDLVCSAQHAPVKTVVPMAMDYELALGKVRVTMTSMHLGATSRTNLVSMVSESPGPVTQK
ncbi:MAG: hypothetical protein WCI20_00785 [bacterium]